MSLLGATILIDQSKGAQSITANQNSIFFYTFSLNDKMIETQPKLDLIFKTLFQLIMTFRKKML